MNTELYKLASLVEKFSELEIQCLVHQITVAPDLLTPDEAKCMQELPSREKKALLLGTLFLKRNCDEWFGRFLRCIQRLEIQDTTLRVEINDLSNTLELSLSRQLQMDTLDTFNPKPLPDCSQDELQSRVEITETNLGHGGYGYVYKAVDRITAEEYAVKLIDTDISESKYLTRECDILKEVSKLTSPNIVMYHGYWKDDTRTKNLPQHYKQQMCGITWCLVFELCDSSLKDYLQLTAHESLENTQRARGYYESAVKGVKFLHDNQICHRDLKPANILVKGEIAKITDFGFTRKLSSRSGSSSALTNGIGTKWYTSPQQQNPDGKYNLKTDIYALGKILLEIYGKRSINEKADAYYRRLDSAEFKTELEKGHPEVAKLAFHMLEKYESSRPDINAVLRYTTYFVSCSEEPDSSFLGQLSVNS